jgi:hypothetical protein
MERASVARRALDADTGVPMAERAAEPWTNRNVRAAATSRKNHSTRSMELALNPRRVLKAG